MRFVTSPFICLRELNRQCYQTDEYATIGNYKIGRLLFADDLVLLSSSEFGLQRALNNFADACDTAGIKISTTKTEVLNRLRNPDQCSLQLNGAKQQLVEKFKYLEDAFTRGGVEDTWLEAKAKNSSSEDRHSRGQGQECSRPSSRPRTKDTNTSVQKKGKKRIKVFKTIFEAISKENEEKVLKNFF